MPQAMHLYLVVWLLPVAGHHLLNEVANFHVPISTQHDHLDPPKAHSHFDGRLPQQASCTPR
jgi:hypothetical protein